ncbi:MAG: TIGR04282 family arsenosugar biosynthesis glycosyltransferase [Burkholderiales bacterium]
MRVIVFAKAPIAGIAKTRLIPHLGAEGAAALHAAMVERMVVEASAAVMGPVELACAPDISHPLFQSLSRRHGITLAAQGDGDLGERMCRALDRAILQEGAGIIVGSDCAALDRHYLHAARAALDDGAPVVVGPAEDGGYVLIGGRISCPAIFEGIDWGTDTVLHATRQALRAGAIGWRELATLWDVDRPEDVTRLSIEYPALALAALPAVANGNPNRNTNRS